MIHNISVDLFMSLRIVNAVYIKQPQSRWYRSGLWRLSMVLMTSNVHFWEIRGYLSG